MEKRESDRELFLEKANDRLHKVVDLPDEIVKGCWKCHMKSATSGSLYVTNHHIVFICSNLMGRSQAKVHCSYSDILDLFLNGKTLCLVTWTQGTLPKQVVFEKFEGGEDGLNRCYKTVKRVFYGIDGDGVLHSAIGSRDYYKVTAILDNRIQALEDFSRNGSPLSLACQKNDLKMVSILLGYYDKHRDQVDINRTLPHGEHVLHIACRVPHIENQILKELLNFKGIDVTAKISYDDTTPLHYFCAHNHSPSCVEIGELFFVNGASANARTHHGETPLHKAIFNSAVRVLMIKMLIDHGALADIKGGSHGDTPLHYAIRLNRPDLVLELLAAGVDMSIMNNAGESIIETAKKGMKDEASPQMEEIIKMLEDVLTLNTILLDSHAIELSKHFIREKMFYADVLAYLTADDLEKAPFEIKYGQRKKLLENLATFKKTYEEKRALQVREKSRKKQQAILQGKGEHSANTADVRRALEIGDDGRWEIPSDEVEFTAKISSGQYGTVYKGLYKGQVVAIKLLDKVDFESQLTDFKQEFDILRKVHSPCIITFFGAIIERNLGMVMEFCERGSLYDVLRKDPHQNWKMLLSFAHDMALGVSALHNAERQILHRDLKSLNLLVSHDWRVKVCDFGLSRTVNSADMETFKQTRGTMAYCDPEIVNQKICTDKSDVYSMGIVLWELMHIGVKQNYEAPLSEYDIPNRYAIMMQASKGLRPSIPIGCPLDLVALYFKCVGREPTLRPSALEFVAAIEECQDSYLKDPDAWLQNTFGEEDRAKYTIPTDPDCCINFMKQGEGGTAGGGFKGWGSKDKEKDRDKKEKGKEKEQDREPFARSNGDSKKSPRSQANHSKRHIRNKADIESPENSRKK